MSMPSIVEPLEVAAPSPLDGVGARIGAAQRQVIAAWLARLGLRWRFRAVVLAFGLPFLGFVLWTATEQAATEKAHVYQRAKVHASLLAVRLEDYVAEVDRLLAGATLTIAPRLGGSAPVGPALQALRHHLPHSIYNIGVWSLDGSNIASLERSSGGSAVNVADRNYFKEALKRRDLAIEGPLVSRTTGDPIVQFARPILDADGHPIAVLSMSCRLRELIDQIDEAGRISDGALVTIVDREGIVVARSSDALFWIGRRVPQPERITSAFAKQQGASEQVGADGELRLSGYAAASTLPWLVIVGEPIEQAIAPVGARLLRVLGIGIAIFAVALLIAGRAASWTLRPLLRLASDTERLRRGELGHRSTVVTGGEIASLAEDFNRMAESLQERDRALAASELRLRAIADNMPAQITYIDRDERYRFVNAYRGPLPLPKESMIGRTVCETRGAALYAQIAPHLHAALTGVACTFEGVIDTGATRQHYRCTYVPERGPDGRVDGIYAFTHDITETKTAELERQESQRRLVTITDNVPALISYIDGDRRFRFANRAHERWFKRPVADVIGQSFADVLDPAVTRQFEPHFVRGMNGETCAFEVEVPREQRASRWIRCTFIPDRDDDEHVRGIYGMIHDITEAKEGEARLMRIARLDALTGLANRRMFNELLDASMAAPDRPDRGRVGLMFLDIDHFKQVNDRFGHATGDALLKAFAARLADNIRPTDTAARLAGDEFVVLLEDVRGDEEPHFIARKIIDALRQPFFVEERLLRVSASIGIVLRDDADDCASKLMRRADAALYDAKRAGRDTFRMAS